MADPHLSIEFCRRVIWEVACPGHAHHRGVIHRDIKPANILLDESDRVLITDFGIAKAAEGLTQLTSTGMVLGTPQYMSPEQAMGEAVSGASDQYSLGMTGYHLLAGRPAFLCPRSTRSSTNTSTGAPAAREIRPDIPVPLPRRSRGPGQEPNGALPRWRLRSAIWPAAGGASGTSPTVISASAARLPARRPALQAHGRGTRGRAWRRRFPRRSATGSETPRNPSSGRPRGGVHGGRRPSAGTSPRGYFQS
jgi:serine/threonine protein kinase